MDQLEKNKTHVMAFYDMMFNECKVAEAFATYAAPPYLQHNPMLPDGIQPAVEYFERMSREYPGKRVHFKRAFADGDHVILHCQQLWPGDGQWAGIDIFRLNEEGKVVEHWDVLQLVPPTSANPNTMF